jgi:hypothetical protein
MNKNFKTNVNIPDVEGASVDSELSLFDKNNPDINLFNLVDEENIRLSGSKINYYKYIQSKAQIDDVYMEERNKTISNTAVIVYGHYDPKVVEEPLNQFGIQLTNDQIFTFNKAYLEKKLGRPPLVGDVIEPHFQKIRFEIFEVQEDSFEAYGVYHYICTAKVLRDSSDIQTMRLTDVADDVGGRNL